MNKILLLLTVIATGASGPLRAQPAPVDPLDHQFTYSLIDTTGGAAALVEAIDAGMITAMSAAGARRYALWTPVTKPADAPFAGLDAGRVILMLAWPGPPAAMVDSLDSELRALPGVADVTTRVYSPVYLSDGLEIPTGKGFYVHRDEHYAAGDMDTAVRLSREAWVTWEPHWGVKVVGLFRELGVDAGIARLNRIAWYPDYAVWLATRDNDDAESRRRFQERRQFLIEGSGVAVATDRHLGP